MATGIVWPGTGEALREPTTDWPCTAAVGPLAGEYPTTDPLGVAAGMTGRGRCGDSKASRVGVAERCGEGCIIGAPRGVCISGGWAIGLEAR